MIKLGGNYNFIRGIKHAIRIKLLKIALTTQISSAYKHEMKLSIIFFSATTFILEKKVFKNVCNIRLELLNYQNVKLNLIRNCDLQLDGIMDLKINYKKKENISKFAVNNHILLEK